MGEGVLTPPFPRVDGCVHCGSQPAEELAERFGTPLYVYDMDHVAARLRCLREAFAPADPLVAYSVKANGNLTLLARLGRLGCGADVTGLGELLRARRAGIPPERIVFAGVGKSAPEIRAALEEGIHGFNVESAGELRRIEAVATELGVRAPFAVRVNPDVLARTPHEYTATGHAAAKFGVPLEEARALYRWARGRPHLLPRGVDVHIGSQVVDVDPYVSAVDVALALADELRAEGVVLDYLDVGGGFGIRYDEGPELDLGALAAEVVPRILGSGLGVVVEPGRWLVGEAGVLLTRVEYVKETPARTFVVADAGMSELIRPSHYGGYHEIRRADDRRRRPRRPVDVVGPLCETGDFLARRRELEVPEPGELLVVSTCGAYGFSMASNYNGRPRPAEVLVEDGRARLVRRRETFEDMIHAEEDL